MAPPRIRPTNKIKADRAPSSTAVLNASPRPRIVLRFMCLHRVSRHGYSTSS